MAMGDYPYESVYILNGKGFLPAWPVRVACEALDFDDAKVCKSSIILMTLFPTYSPNSSALWWLKFKHQANNTTLLEGLRDAVSVYYNYSREGDQIQCYDIFAGANEESQIVE